MFSELVTTVSRGAVDDRPRDLGRRRPAGQADRRALGHPRRRLGRDPQLLLAVPRRCDTAAAARTARPGPPRPRACGRAGAGPRAAAGRAGSSPADTPSSAASSPTPTLPSRRQLARGSLPSRSACRMTRSLVRRPDVAMRVVSCTISGIYSLRSERNRARDRDASRQSGAGPPGSPPSARRQCSRSPASASSRSAAARRSTWPRPMRRPREAAGAGETDAFPASEMPADAHVRPGGRDLALGHDHRGRAPARPALPGGAQRSRSPRSPARRCAERRDRGDRARLRRRGVGRPDPLRDDGAGAPAGLARHRRRPARPRRPSACSRLPLPDATRPTSRFVFLGARLDGRAGQRGRAQAARGGRRVGRGVPGDGVPPRPDQRRRRRHAGVADRRRRRRPCSTPPRAAGVGDRARTARARSPRSCSPSASAVALARARGLDPDHPVPDPIGGAAMRCRAQT